MDGTAEYEGIKFENGSFTKVNDPLTIEHPLEISINGKPFTVVMQTPGDEEDLTRGLLFAEDVIQAQTVFKFTAEKNEQNLIDKINVEIPPDQLGDGYLSARSLLSVSSCGICGKQSLEDLQVQKGESLENPKNKNTYSLETLFEMQQKMFQAQNLFQLTGGCHGVAAFSIEGELLSLKEDIGRHNAMDKVIGNLLRSNQAKKAKIIMFSGRISYEIVSKAFRAKIPLIMAVSAPSTLAIDFAKEYGITLLSFSRNGKSTCYANCQLIS
jgi:FdhD protein